jgi:tetratricopeptide (TPR) repeat protein
MNFTKLLLISIILILARINPATAQQNKIISQDIIMDFGLNFARACDRNEFVLAFAYRACKNAGYNEIYDVKDQVSKISDQKESRELFFKQFYLEYPEDTKMIYGFSMVMNMNVDNSKILAKYIIDKYGAEKKKEQEAIAAKQKIEVEKKEKERLNSIAKIEKDFNDCKNEIEKPYSNGVTKIKNENYDGAIEDLELSLSKCNEALAKTFEGDKSLANYTTEIKGFATQISRQLSIAEPRAQIFLLDKKIIENPKDGEAYLLRGKNRILLLVKGLSDRKSLDSISAWNDLNKSIELNPKSDSAYYSRGYFNVMVNADYKGGLADFNKTIKLNSKYADAYLSRARIKEAMDDIRGMEADMKKHNELIKETEKKK